MSIEKQQLRQVFSILLKYQDNRQSLLLDKQANKEYFQANIDGSWEPIHYAVDMLNHIIEESIEAKRLIKARKWWSDPLAQVQNTEQLLNNTQERQELIEELIDIFVQWINCCVYLSVDGNELATTCITKMATKNNPNSDQYTLGQRS